MDRISCRQPFNVCFNLPFQAELEITSLFIGDDKVDSE